MKGLSKNANSKRDPSPSTGTQIQKETSISTPSISPEVSDNIMDYNKPTEAKKQVEQMPWQSQSGEPDAWSYSLSNQGFASMEDSVLASFSREKDQAMAKDTMSSSFTYQREPAPERNELERVSPPHRKVVKEERQEKYKEYNPSEEFKVEKNASMPKRAFFKEEPARPKDNTFDAVASSQNGYDSQITAILEVELTYLMMLVNVLKISFSIHQFSSQIAVMI